MTDFFCVVGFICLLFVAIFLVYSLIIFASDTVNRNMDFDKFKEKTNMDMQSINVQLHELKIKINLPVITPTGYYKKKGKKK